MPTAEHQDRIFAEAFAGGDGQPSLGFRVVHFRDTMNQHRETRALRFRAHRPS
ncbi:hypothetical protein ACW4TU_31275 [Streptomyces sp. QTS52]